MADQTVTEGEQHTNAESDAPATKVVDFGDQKIELPAEQAEAIIAERQRLKEQQQDLALKLKAEAEAKAAAEQKAVDESRRAQAIESLKKQDIEAAEKILSEKYETELTRKTAALKDLRLQAMLATREDLVPSAVKDIAEALGSKLTIGSDDNLAVAGTDGLPLADPQTGAPISVDAYIEQYLSDRPHYKRSTVPTSTSAAPGGEAPKSTPAPITQQALEAMSQADRRAHFAAGGQLKE